jgi:hypothetical protein
MRAIQADTEALRKERRGLLEDIRTMATGLVDVADAAAARVMRQEPAEPKKGTLEPK